MLLKRVQENHTRAHTLTHTHTLIHIHSYTEYKKTTHALIHLHIHTRSSTYTHTQYKKTTHALIHLHIHTRSSTYTHTPSTRKPHTRLYTYTDTHTHTHTVDSSQEVGGVSVELLLEGAAYVGADGARKQLREEVDEPRHPTVRHDELQPVQINRSG